MPVELIGATYFFDDESGNIFVFSINMTQANDPKEISDFALWFGPINHPSIQQRIQALSDFFEENGVHI